MRWIPYVDNEAVEMFALSSGQASQANGLLEQLGKIPMAECAALACRIAPNAADAAMWRALGAPAPWPWLAAELEEAMIEEAETGDGQALFCCLILQQSTGSSKLDAMPPLESLARLERLGFKPASCSADPEALLAKPPSWIMGLRQALAQGVDVRLPEPPAQAGAVQAVAWPLLYAPSRFGDYSEMPNSERALLVSSIAQIASESLCAESPQKALIATGRIGDILRRAPELCAPIWLRAKAESICSISGSSTEQLAASVSFHRHAGRQWMRIALRSADTGFCLDGIDWPCLDTPEALDQAFSNLLDCLEAIGIQWCYQIEELLGPMQCVKCGDPVYPMPIHAEWRQAHLDAGASPDGEHTH